MDFLHYVQGIVILDQAGKRIFAKYYTKGDVSEPSKSLDAIEKQRQLECAAFQTIKDSRCNLSLSSDEDIMIIDQYTILFQQGDDVVFMVVGHKEENELVLNTVLRTLIDALKQVLNTPQLYTRLLLENYNGIVLTVDEMIDGGIILETDPTNIASEVVLHSRKAGSDVAYKAISTVNRYLRDNM
ncbi:unnamed protein product [Phytomonas sp. EM1]|nr:unnamed protein product [Phytomonas sp. EM1]|eukprot:CCW64785.1 unnamed protein product [Phytomonas sp. isolate EM1]